MSRANEPAFVMAEGPQHPRYTYGLTIREHFAAMAMQGLASNNGLTSPLPLGVSTYREAIAVTAVALADALIAELAKPKELPLDERGFAVQP